MLCETPVNENWQQYIYDRNQYYNIGELKQLYHFYDDKQPNNTHKEFTEEMKEKKQIILRQAHTRSIATTATATAVALAYFLCYTKLVLNSFNTSESQIC